MKYLIYYIKTTKHKTYETNEHCNCIRTINKKDIKQISKLHNIVDNKIGKNQSIAIIPPMEEME